MTETTRRVRTPQAQRSALTRAKALDATVEALIEIGYARTTTHEVARRSGLSRGALLHQFPTREALVVAAVEHLVERRLAEILATPRTATDGPEILLEVFDGPLFYAALELWVAARTDPGLRTAMTPLEQSIVTALAEGGRELFGDRYTPEQFELSIELARGLAVSRILRSPDTDRELTERLLPAWKEMVNNR